ncbi:hypothetical protein [Lysobacter gummosus]|uniref:hypothetical protein n=1 Tax=Lysobacter gummosus TaxID=262324 RepID=UPI003636CE30
MSSGYSAGSSDWIISLSRWQMLSIARIGKAILFAASAAGAWGASKAGICGVVAASAISAGAVAVESRVVIGRSEWGGAEPNQ